MSGPGRSIGLSLAVLLLATGAAAGGTVAVWSALDNPCPSPRDCRMPEVMRVPPGLHSDGFPGHGAGPKAGAFPGRPSSSDIPVVPVPPGGALMLTALGLAAWLRRRGEGG